MVSSAFGRARGYVRRWLVPAVLWLVAAASIGAALFLVLRSCSYDGRAVAAYGLYFVLHVMVPGIVALAAIRGRALSWTETIALGVPMGFTVEVFSFL
ncbi:MAG: hypothetical protein V4773_14705, partial [Verrucomicrobiota bacterium]